MIANHFSRVIVVALVLVPSIVYCSLRLNPDPRLIDASKLEYRLATPRDVLIHPLSHPGDSGVFVAVDPKTKVVLGTLEFGVANNTGGSYHLVFIPDVFVQEGYRGQGIGSELYKRFIEYVENVSPEVNYIWMKVFRGNEGGNLAPLKAGFQFEDHGGEFIHYFYELPGHFEDGPKKPYNGPLPVLPEVVAELLQPAEH